MFYKTRHVQLLATPVVPLRGDVDVDNVLPKVGRDVGLEVVGGFVEEGRDDDIAVEVFGGVVQNLPAAGGLDARPCRSLPEVIELPV